MRRGCAECWTVHKQYKGGAVPEQSADTTLYTLLAAVLWVELLEHVCRWWQ